MEPITKAEFDAVAYRSAEGNAFRALMPGTGLKLPCRWKHRSKGNICSGGQLARTIARRHSMTIRARCKDGMLYVWRFP